MKHFSLINGDKTIHFMFPVSLDEIRTKYLEKVTSGIKVSDNYVLVGLVYHETLGSIIITRKQAKKSVTTGVVPIFIKAGNTDNEFIKSIKIKDKLVIPTSSLTLAHHVIAPKNTLSIDWFIKYLDKDTTVASRYNNNYGKEECYFLEFKLVPACEILGYYGAFESYPDIYFKIVDNNNDDESLESISDSSDDSSDSDMSSSCS